MGERKTLEEEDARERVVSGSFNFRVCCTAARVGHHMEDVMGAKLSIRLQSLVAMYRELGCNVPSKFAYWILQSKTAEQLLL